MDILFYANSNPLADIIRLETEHRGETFAGTPSHCAARFDTRAAGCEVFESLILSGVTCRQTEARDTWGYTVPLPNEPTAFALAERLLWRQTRYGIDAVLATFFGDRLPPGLRLVDDQACPDCSLFVAHLLIAGGLTLPDWPGPPSPNDILLWAQAQGFAPLTTTKED